MTPSETLRSKVRPALLDPSADGLNRALKQLIDLQQRFPGLPNTREAPAVLIELEGISHLARLARRHFGAMLSAGSPADDSDANYTHTGRMDVHAPAQPLISQVLHG